MRTVPQAFDLKLRIFSKQEFSCPLCHCPLNLAAIFNEAPQMPAASVPTRAPMGPLNGLEKLAETWCIEARIAPEDLRSRNRFSELVALRARFCHAMRERGYSLSTIGRYLGIHHSSVLHLLRRKPKERAA